MRDADIEALMRLNTLSPIVLSKYVVRGMMAEGRGRVINISSIVASTGFNGLSVYAATKASLVGFTRSLAREVGRVGVTVNAIAPGFVDTEMTQGLEDASRERVVARSALRRLADARRRRRDGGVSDGRGRTQHHRRGDDGGRGGDGVVELLLVVVLVFERDFQLHAILLEFAVPDLDVLFHDFRDPQLPQRLGRAFNRAFGGEVPGLRAGSYDLDDFI